MHRRTVMKLSGGALGSVLISLIGARIAAASSRSSAGSTIALGAYIPGAPDDPTQIDTFTATVGVSPAVVMWYQDWEHSGFDTAGMNNVSARGLMPMITWQPFDYTLGVSQPNYSLARIIDGTHDAYITQWAQVAAAYSKPFYLRFAHEMNGNWYPWGYGVNGNTSGQYIAAWRHVYTLFQQAGAVNIRWIWSPNVAGNGKKNGTATSAFSSLYPGDAYVHWVAMDGFNWGTSQSWSSWQSLSTIFGATYGPLARMTKKPMMIAETASAEVGGNKASWITTGLSSTIPSSFPRIQAVIWFDENKETDWRVNSTTTALAAYSSVAKSATYQGRLA